MAHQITIRENGFAEMAFVGDTPWHGLGQALEREATIETWCEAAGMDWTIEKTPAVYMPEGGFTCRIPDRYVQYRSDTRAPLSVVSERYKPVQPKEILEFFRDLMDESGFPIEMSDDQSGRIAFSKHMRVQLALHRGGQSVQAEGSYGVHGTTLWIRSIHLVSGSGVPPSMKLELTWTGPSTVAAVAEGREMLTLSRNSDQEPGSLW